MRRISVAASLGLLAVLLLAMPAVAGRAWCKADPIVKLNGVTYQVIVSIPQENVAQVNGPLLFEISSPEDTKRELLFVDAGYNGHGEKIVFKKYDVEDDEDDEDVPTAGATKQHVFFLKVPKNNDDFPVLMEIYQDGTLIKSVEGTTNGIQVAVP